MRTLLALSLAACSTSSAVEDDASRPLPAFTVVPPTQPAEYYDTVVTVEGGHTTVTYEPTTIEQQREDNAKRANGESERIVVDTACSGNSFWLYDTVNTVGNRICFRQAFTFLSNTIDLANYPRTWDTSVSPPVPTSDWGLTVGSFWPGADPGRLSDEFNATDSTMPLTFVFDRWGPFTPFERAPTMFGPNKMRFLTLTR